MITVKSNQNRLTSKILKILEYEFIPSYKRKHFKKFKDNFPKEIKPFNHKDIIIVVVFCIHDFYKDFNPGANGGYFEYIKDVFTKNNKGLFIGWYKKEYPKNRIFIKVLKFDKDGFKRRYAHII